MSTTTAIKERPILMSGPMVRAILGGTKSMTRRVIKPQPAWRVIPDSERSKFNDTGWWWTRKDGTVIHSQPDEAALIETFSRSLDWCPYGKPGERLWVKETFARRLDVDPSEEPEKARHYALYRANGTGLDEPHWHSYPCRWTPSIHMPRWASRITLEITEVRAERLEKITNEDAIAEGAIRHDFPGFDGPRWLMEETKDPAQTMGTPRLAFGNYWNKLRGDKSGYWPEPSPWVWAITFRRLEAS